MSCTILCPLVRWIHEPVEAPMPLASRDRVGIAVPRRAQRGSSGRACPICRNCRGGRFARP
eukprot:11215353-Lingulodinium_polyedra.AAC.1